MSDDTASAPEKSPKSEAAPRTRRVSTPKPRKVAKKAAPAQEAAPDAEIASIPFPEPPAPAPAREVSEEPSSQAGGDWPEPEAASTGGAPTPAETAKRKRRRRKGKGQSAGPQSAGLPAGDEVQVVAESKPNEAPQEQRPRPAPAPQPQPQRPKIDPELLTKMAWKIYLAEVSEEGVALIGDSDAKDLSRRCFRLAEIFIEEQARRR